MEENKLGRSGVATAAHEKNYANLVCDGDLLSRFLFIKSSCIRLFCPQKAASNLRYQIFQAGYESSR